jgi:hypothetical protein
LMDCVHPAYSPLWESVCETAKQFCGTPAKLGKLHECIYRLIDDDFRVYFLHVLWLAITVELLALFRRRADFTEKQSGARMYADWHLAEFRMLSLHECRRRARKASPVSRSGCFEVSRTNYNCRTSPRPA